jgi:uncharacterized cupredoxin-like copper-binding protein
MRKMFGVIALSMLLLAACGGASSGAAGGSPGTGGTAVTVELSDFKIKPSVASTKAGKVEFQIRNTAAMLHELKVIRTDLDEDKLPIDAAKAQAKEDGKVGGIENIPAGAIRTLSLDLAAGKYVLICNVAGHYQLGMHVAFKVE